MFRFVKLQGGRRVDQTFHSLIFSGIIETYHPIKTGFRRKSFALQQVDDVKLDSVIYLSKFSESNLSTLTLKE